MSAIETTLPFRNTTLFARHWPTDMPQAVVGIVHGFGEHSGRYEHVADFLNQHDYAVTTYDLPGHGRTPGKRGHVDRYDILLDSVQALLDFTKANYPTLPVFLFGHSMGGNILANFLIQRQPTIKAAILQASWLKIPYDPPKFEIWLAKTMRNIYPSLQVSSKLDATAISVDPKVVDVYKRDPLNHDKITPGWFFGAFEAQQFAIQNARKISVPTLVMHGTVDRLAGFSGSEDLVKNGSTNLTFRSWEGFYHELHNEPRQAEVFQFMLDWMDEQLES